MSETPLSPRQRLLAEDDPVEEAAGTAERRAAELAAAQARAGTVADPSLVMGHDDTLAERTEAPPVLTLSELYGINDRLQALDDAVQAQLVHSGMAGFQADDELQGALVVVAMSFGGDVQTEVFEILRLYRQLKGLAR